MIFHPPYEEDLQFNWRGFASQESTSIQARPPSGFVVGQLAMQARVHRHPAGEEGRPARGAGRQHIVVLQRDACRPLDQGVHHLAELIKLQATRSRFRVKCPGVLNAMSSSSGRVSERKLTQRMEGMNMVG